MRCLLRCSPRAKSVAHSPFTFPSPKSPPKIEFKNLKDLSLPSRVVMFGKVTSKVSVMLAFFSSTQSIQVSLGKVDEFPACPS